MLLSKKSSMKFAAGLLLLVMIGLCAFFVISAKGGIHEEKITLDSPVSDYYAGTGTLREGDPVAKYTSEKSTGYLNADGTVTVDVFAVPIRFINKDKELQDIDCRICNVEDPELRKAGYLYTVAANDIEPFYPKELSPGVLVKRSSFGFLLGTFASDNVFAEYVEKESVAGIPQKMVEYKNVFSGNAALDFYPSSLGTNMELDLTSPPEDGSFQFWIEAKDCNVSLEAGGYILFTNDTVVPAELGYLTNERLGIIQAPLLKDSQGKTSYRSTMEIAGQEDGRYLITLHLDKEFLSSEDTAYPVKAYSSFELVRDKEPDSALYSGKPMVNSYLSNYSVIGNSEDWGDGQLRVRFSLSKAVNIKAAQLLSANYQIFNFSSQNGGNPLELCTITDDWCSLATHWADGIRFGERTAYLENPSESILTFDITEEAKKWYGAPSRILEHQGVLLKSASGEEGDWNILLSNDNALFNNRTEMVIQPKK